MTMSLESVLIVWKSSFVRCFNTAGATGLVTGGGGTFVTTSFTAVESAVFLLAATGGGAAVFFCGVVFTTGGVVFLTAGGVTFLTVGGGITFLGSGFGSGCLLTGGRVGTGFFVTSESVFFITN